MSRLDFCKHHDLQEIAMSTNNPESSFAATGTIAVVIAWFILPEVTRRTPGEIDELYDYSSHQLCRHWVLTMLAGFRKRLTFESSINSSPSLRCALKLNYLAIHDAKVPRYQSKVYSVTIFRILKMHIVLNDGIRPLRHASRKCKPELNTNLARNFKGCISNAGDWPE